jgi:hypothetical protein
MADDHPQPSAAGAEPPGGDDSVAAAPGGAGGDAAATGGGGDGDAGAVGGESGQETDPAAGERSPWRSMARLLLLTVAGCLVAGAALGVLWWRLAPRVPLEVVGEVAVPDEYQPGGFVAADGVFAVLAGVAGLVVAWLLLWRGVRPLRVLAAGVVGGLAGSLVMWAVATRLGQVDVAAAIAAAADGAVFDGPLRLRLPGLLLLWPIATASLVTATTFVDWWVERRGHRRSAE